MFWKVAFQLVRHPLFRNDKQNTENPKSKTNRVLWTPNLAFEPAGNKHLNPRERRHHNRIDDTFSVVLLASEKSSVGCDLVRIGGPFQSLSHYLRNSNLFLHW